MLSDQEGKLSLVVDPTQIKESVRENNPITGELKSITMEMIQNRINKIQRITTTNSKLLSKLIGN